MAKKPNTKKFEDEVSDDSVVRPVYETAEEAVAEAKREAEEANVLPSAINVTFRDGYANGDGDVFVAYGVTAGKPKRDGKPIGD